MGTLLTLAAVIFVLGWLATLARSGSLVRPGGLDPRWLAAVLLPVLGLALLACLVLGVVALADLVYRTDVTGRVIDRWVQERLSDRGALGRRRYWIAVDDGRREPVPALRVDGDLFDWAVVGADVRLRVSPLLRYAHSLEVRRDPEAEDQATLLDRADRSSADPDAPETPDTPDAPGAPDSEAFAAEGSRSRARHLDPATAGIPDPRSLVVPAEAAAALGCAVRGEPLPVLSDGEPVLGVTAWAYLPTGALPTSRGQPDDAVEVYCAHDLTSAAVMIPLIRDSDVWWPLGTARSPRDVPGLGVQARFYGALLAALHPRAIFAVRVHRHGVPDTQATVALAELAVQRLNARRDGDPPGR
jgi:hypothetical protein